MKRLFLILLLGVLIFSEINTAQTDSLSADESAIAANIKLLRSESNEIRASAAKELRRIIAKYPSGTSIIRYADGGEASWRENIDQVKQGMTEAEVARFLPVLTESPEISGNSYLRFHRLDYHWSVGVPYRKPGIVNGPPTLFKGEMLVFVRPPTNYTGDWETWYVNGQKAYIHQVKNAKTNGLMTHFDWNGSKSADQYYVEGVLDGPGTFWHANGKIRQTVFYKNGKLEGRMTDWYASGEKESDFGFKNGERDGVCIRWYKNGQKQFEMNYKNGIQHGPEFTWDEQGVLRAKREYENGKVVK